jgi:hypothetical protein
VVLVQGKWVKGEASLLLSCIPPLISDDFLWLFRPLSPRPCPSARFELRPPVPSLPADEPEPGAQFAHLRHRAADAAAGNDAAGGPQHERHQRQDGGTAGALQAQGARRAPAGSWEWRLFSPAVPTVSVNDPFSLPSSLHQWTWPQSLSFLCLLNTPVSEHQAEVIKCHLPPACVFMHLYKKL